MTPEFSRPFTPDTIPAGGQTIDLTASPAECSALSARMKLPAIKKFSCGFRMVKGFGGTIEATGRLRARLVQICVVTLEEFTADLDENFALRFVPQGRETFDADPDSVDEITYAGGTIDLGEAAAEQLALVLDPYPRKPGVTLPLVDAADHEPETLKTPFAALAALKFTGRPD